MATLKPSITSLVLAQEVRCAYSHEGEQCSEKTKVKVRVTLQGGVLGLEVLSAPHGMSVNKMPCWICKRHIAPALDAGLIKVVKGLIDVSFSPEEAALDEAEEV